MLLVYTEYALLSKQRAPLDVPPWGHSQLHSSISLHRQDAHGESPSPKTLPYHSLATSFFKSKARIACTTDVQPSAVELGDNGLLPAMVLVDLALGQTLGAELDVGRQLSSGGLLAQNLGDLNWLLLQLNGHSGKKFTNGEGCGNSFVGNTATEKLGEPLDELDESKNLAISHYSGETAKGVRQT